LSRSVVASLVFHVAMILLALRLPAVSSRPKPTAIEVDVQTRRPVVEVPPPRPIETPKPPEPKLAMHTRERSEPRPRIKEEPRPVETPPTPPSPLPPPEHPAPTPPGKVDLTLHALPGSTAGSVILPAAPAGGGTFGTGAPAAPRKEWKPRGDAGDPILGKIRETPEERFPLERVGRDEFVYKGPQFSAHIQPDGSVSFDDKIIRDFKGTSGSWDLNDLIAKGRHEDPYRAEKAAFMKATEAKRDELARRARQAQLRGSLARLPSHLEAVWADRRAPARERRRVLFELWREAFTGDGDEGAAGAEARAIIEAFIRNRLPEGSDDAYTDDELQTYARVSRQRFQPYK
jgi:hypothetical protein